MQLVAQDYGEILAALQAANDEKGHERRTAARMEVQAQVKLTPYHEGKAGKSFTCLTRDLSFKGIGLLQGKQSPRGSQFLIELPRRNAEAPLTLLCSVMYCRELAEGLYNVGASFIEVYDPNTPAKRSSPGVSELDRIRQSILG